MIPGLGRSEVIIIVPYLHSLGTELLATGSTSQPAGRLDTHDPIF